MSKELKTLKDIARYCSLKKRHHRPRQRGRSSHYIQEYVNSYLLRQEAIKWIKSLDEEMACSYGARTILVKFFNITEEDLK